MTPVIVKFPEGVEKSVLDEPLKPGPLLVRETMAAPVGLGMREIDLAVGHVQIPAKNNRPLFLDFFKVRQKSNVPLLGAIIQS